MSIFSRFGIATTCLCISFFLGCSVASTPTSAVTGSFGSSAFGNLQPGSDRILFGIWKIHIDPMTDQITVLPDRDLLTHYNVAKMISPPNCSDCVTVKVLQVNPTTHVYSLEVAFKNPTKLTGFDVRGTLLFGPTDNRTLLNPDAYTKIFAPDAKSPFMAFAKDQPLRRFVGGAQFSEEYDIVFPPPMNKNVTYAVDASYPANQEEPYAFSDTHLDGSVTSDNSTTATFYTTVSDWQNNISSVSLDLGSIGGAVIPMTPVGSGIYKVSVGNDAKKNAGQYPLWIDSKSSGSDYSLYAKYMLTIDPGSTQPITYPVVDTSQSQCYDNANEPMTPPSPGDPLYGQDAQYSGIQPSYTDNGDGTVTDNVTGLMWQKDPGSTKHTWDDAMAGASSFNLAGYTDWRLPTIKELYSLINFTGYTGADESSSKPYIDTNYFAFQYGNTAIERFIDAQEWSSTKYVSTTMDGNVTAFGVNFADGRIKGYGITHPDGSQMLQFVRYVRGPAYGANNFVDNGDGTITDKATGLMWMKVDSGNFKVGDKSDGTLNWQQALDWAENLDYAGYTDWRLPNAKELQSIVDYTRSPILPPRPPSIRFSSPRRSPTDSTKPTGDITGPTRRISMVRQAAIKPFIWPSDGPWAGCRCLPTPEIISSWTSTARALSVATRRAAIRRITPTASARKAT